LAEHSPEATRYFSCLAGFAPQGPILRKQRIQSPLGNKHRVSRQENKSRPHTNIGDIRKPDLVQAVDDHKDNPEIERFNRTVEYEWLYNFNSSLDPEELNPGLTEWLIEYNFNRPHQSLGYLAHVEYIERELAKIRSPVLPMWSASTSSSIGAWFMV